MQDPNESFNKCCKSGNVMLNSDKDVNEIEEQEEECEDFNLEIARGED